MPTTSRQTALATITRPIAGDVERDGQISLIKGIDPFGAARFALSRKPCLDGASWSLISFRLESEIRNRPHVSQINSAKSPIRGSASLAGSFETGQLSLLQSKASLPLILRRWRRRKL